MYSALKQIMDETTSITHPLLKLPAARSPSTLVLMPTPKDPAFYCLNAGSLPDELYKPAVPVSAWLSRCTTAGAEGFPAGSLASLDAIPLLVLCERLIGIPVYMLFNVLPFAVPLLLLSGLFKLALLYYVLPLLGLALLFFAIFWSKGTATGEGGGGRAQQYLYTERNSTRYVSLKMVWPASLHFPLHEGKQLIFCAIPHGLAPLGIVGYAIWSKLFTDRLCRWTAAPVVLKIPLVGMLMKYCGCALALPA